MGAIRIPKDVAAAINECWPDGVLGEFATDKSYFHEIHPRLERDLRDISEALLLWQTEEAESGAHWNNDWEDEPPLNDEWQSYLQRKTWHHGGDMGTVQVQPIRWRLR